MRVKVLQEELLKALSVCSRFSSNRVQLPVLANILLETSKNKFILSSTNLEISVSVSIGAKVEEEGSITIPSKIITELVSNLKSGQTELISEKEILNVKSADFEAKLTGINSADFPSIPRDIGASSIKFAVGSLQDAITKILFSVSNDETRPVLTGVLIIFKNKEVVLVSTDGFRLTQKKVKNPLIAEEKRMIIPKNTMSELVRIASGDDIDFSHKKAENQVIFGFSNTVLSSRIIEGDFPDFERIIPKESKIKVRIDKDEFLRTIKLASVFAKDSANVIKIEVGKEYLEIVAESQQFGSDKARVEAKVEGGDKDGKFLIAFNYKFLEEYLNVIESDELIMEFSDPNSPVLFLDPKDADLLHIIMPVRLQS